MGDFLDGNFPGGNFPDGSFRDTLFYISFESVKITFKCKTLKFYQGSLNRVLHHLVYGSNENLHFTSIDKSIFTSHFTRTGASSFVLNQLNICTILEKGGWNSKRNFAIKKIKRYIKRLRSGAVLESATLLNCLFWR